MRLKHSHSFLHLRREQESVFTGNNRECVTAGFYHSVTLERRDSWDSSICNSSELSISSSIPVIFPARLGCIAWMRGNRRSPERKKSQQFKTSVTEKTKRSFEEHVDKKNSQNGPSRCMIVYNGWTCLQPPHLTEHLFLFLRRSSS